MSSDTIIRDQQALADFLQGLSAAREVAFDCEFHRERRYHPELFLVQLTDGHSEAALDPRAVDLRALGPLLADPAVTKFVHCGRYDLPLLRRATGEAPINVFDTQVAAAFLGFGANAGFARLAADLLGVEVDKSHQYTRWDGELTPAQIEYALDDVRHLMPIARTLRTRLAERGRLTWAEEESETARRAALSEPDAESIWRGVKRPGKLTGEALGIFREVALWREDVARIENLIVRAVATPDALGQIARKPPSDCDALRGRRGVNFPLAARYWHLLESAIARGRARPVESTPRVRPPEHDTTGARALVSTVRRLRAREHDIATPFLAPDAAVGALIAWVAAGKPDGERPALLEGWRGALLGAELLDLLEGRVSMTVDFDAPLGVALTRSTVD